VNVSGNHTLIGPTARISGTALEETLSSSDRSRYSHLPPDDLLDSGLSPFDSTVKFRVPVPGTSSMADSSWVIAFNPKGEPTVPTDALRPTTGVQMVVIPSAGALPSEAERAAGSLLWIHGATGHTEIYRR
jgi:hypothetical protein